MSSFRYPSQLLHRMTEPQWLTHPTAAQSRLDELEKQEVAFMTELSRQVLPEAPPPIGLGTVSESAETKLKQVEDDILLAPAIQQPFWISHRDIYDGLKQQKHRLNGDGERQLSSDSFAASSMFSPSAMSHGMSTAASPSAMDVSSDSVSSFNLASPTGRMG